MLRRTRIKFCGFSRVTDIQTAVSLGVDAIGLVFYPPSSRFLSIEQACELRRHIPSWATAVGLFVDADPDAVLEHSRRIGLDLIQFHGNETAEQCARSLLPRQPHWRGVRMRSRDDLLASAVEHPAAEALLLDTHTSAYGGAGTAFDWSWVPESYDRPLIMAGGLHSANVGKAIEYVQPAAVDVSSGIQKTPREKDPAKMEAFVRAVLQADAQ